MAEKAAKSIADMGEEDEDSESSAKEEEKTEEADTKQDSDDENAKLRKSALEKLEGASEESLLSQASFFLLLMCKPLSVLVCCWLKSLFFICFYVRIYIVSSSRV